MDWQMILFSVCIVPSKVLGENLERPETVDVIHLPYKPNYQYTRYDSAVLLVELKDQQNYIFIKALFNAGKRRNH